METARWVGESTSNLSFLKKNSSNTHYQRGFVLNLSTGGGGWGESRRFCWCSRQFLRKLICRTMEPQHQGQTCTHQHPLPCLITWRAKHPGWECVKIQYLKQQFAVLTSCKASPVCAQTSGLVPDSRLSLPGLGSFHSGGIVWKRVWSGIWGSCQFSQPGQHCDR